MEQITRINGNRQPYTVDLPSLVWLTDNVNDVALAHIEENTGLVFKKTGWAYTAQPVESKQIVALLLTYNFKTRYYNNADFKNQLHLKGDHHVGFDIESICFDCVKRNRIPVTSLKPGDYLAC